MHIIRFLPFLAYLPFLTISANAQLTTSFASPEILATALMPASFQVSDVSHFGYEYSLGYFNGSNTNIGISQGIILTTGMIAGWYGPQGPNNMSNSGVEHYYIDSSFFTIYLYPAPPPIFDWLQNEIDVPSFYDANILSFKFSTPDNQISFQYVFASEEYNEYVNQYYSGDIFAIFIGNEDSTDIENIAKVPGTNSAITIDNVNNGYSNGCSNGSGAENEEYFIDNCMGTTIQYDGFTKVFTATKNIIPDQTYRIWFVIADAFDGRNDSGVFIKGNHPNSDIDESQATFSPIYPNPSSGHFVLPHLIGPTEVTITNTTGQTIWQQTFTQTGPAEINLDEFSSGIYFLTQNTENQTKTTKIILQK